MPPRVGDRAPQAILELVNGQNEMRFSMTARSVAQSQIQGKNKDLTYYTAENKRKATLFKPNGKKEFQSEVRRQKKSLQEAREPKWYE